MWPAHRGAGPRTGPGKVQGTAATRAVPMKDSPQDTILALSKPQGIMGSKDSLDAAQVWARAVCHSALGPVEGEKFYRQLPALPVLLTYRYLLTTGGWH